MSPTPNPIAKEAGKARKLFTPSSKAIKVIRGPIAVPNMAMRA